MSRFTEKLVVSLEKNGRKWRLEEPFEYYTDITDERTYIQIPEGFETDFASIPKIFVPLVKWKDKFNKAAVVHDYLYHTKQFSRKTADRIFLEAMQVLEIHPVKRFIFYLAVRAFGWTRWKNFKNYL